MKPIPKKKSFVGPTLLLPWSSFTMGLVRLFGVVKGDNQLSFLLKFLKIIHSLLCGFESWLGNLRKIFCDFSVQKFMWIFQKSHGKLFVIILRKSTMFFFVNSHDFFQKIKRIIPKKEKKKSCLSCDLIPCLPD